MLKSNFVGYKSIIFLLLCGCGYSSLPMMKYGYITDKKHINNDSKEIINNQHRLKYQYQITNKCKKTTNIVSSDDVAVGSYVFLIDTNPNDTRIILDNE